MDLPREQAVAKAFVELADTLVADFDVIDFLHLLAERCVQLLEVPAAGLMLADQGGRLRLVAASSESARLLDLFQLETDEGPGLNCYRSGRPARDTDLDRPHPRWPRLAQRAQAAGFRSVHALPMRLRQDVIGVLSLFSTEGAALPGQTEQLGQALADVATIGLLQQRAIRQRQMLAEQLQGALDSRVLIEQAKGALAERMRISVDEAFDVMRRYTRRANRRLTDVARDVINDVLDATEFTASPG